MLLDTDNKVYSHIVCSPQEVIAAFIAMITEVQSTTERLTDVDIKNISDAITSVEIGETLVFYMPRTFLYGMKINRGMWKFWDSTGVIYSQSLIDEIYFLRCACGKRSKYVKERVEPSNHCWPTYDLRPLSVDVSALLSTDLASPAYMKRLEDSWKVLEICKMWAIKRMAYGSHFCNLYRKLYKNFSQNGSSSK